ncbi:MAG TPA: hypothetical protein VGB77_22195 [Abditibacteriaceae bacterium]|jgi:hypothetical protein
MAFDTSNDYSEFDNVDSGEFGTVEGLLPLDGSASAFRYRKILQIVFHGSASDSFSIVVKGNWFVRVRENAERNPDGSYKGAILFAQEVTWEADIIAINMGGIDFVTWAPRGPAGSGEHKTSMVNGEDCAVVSDINSGNEAELAAYGETGAWRFLDNSAVRPTFTPGQKYDVERGFVPTETFKPEGVATIGGFVFFCDWQSADYLCDMPEGAILETVFDHWQVGAIDMEAGYTFSHKAGDELFDGVRDAWTGQGWWIHRADGAMRCARTRRDESFVARDDDPIVLTGAFGSLRLIQAGHNLLVPHQRGAGIGLRYSLDDGREWNGIEDMVTNVTQIDAIKDSSGGSLIILGKAKTALTGPEVIGSVASGDMVRVLLCSTEEKDEAGNAKLWQVKEICKISSSNATALPGKPKGRLTRINTGLEWLVQDGSNVQVWHSTDNGLTWTFMPSTN